MRYQNYLWKGEAKNKGDNRNNLTGLIYDRDNMKRN
jgi:hypothetical protein